MAEDEKYSTGEENEAGKCEFYRQNQAPDILVKHPSTMVTFIYHYDFTHHDAETLIFVDGLLESPPNDLLHA